MIRQRYKPFLFTLISLILLFGLLFSPKWTNAEAITQNQQAKSQVVKSEHDSISNTSSSLTQYIPLHSMIWGTTNPLNDQHQINQMFDYIDNNQNWIVETDGSSGILILDPLGIERTEILPNDDDSSVHYIPLHLWTASVSHDSNGGNWPFFSTDEASRISGNDDAWAVLNLNSMDEWQSSTSSKQMTSTQSPNQDDLSFNTSEPQSLHNQNRNQVAEIEADFSDDAEFGFCNGKEKVADSENESNELQAVNKEKREAESERSNQELEVEQTKKAEDRLPDIDQQLEGETVEKSELNQEPSTQDEADEKEEMEPTEDAETKEEAEAEQIEAVEGKHPGEEGMEENEPDQVPVPEEETETGKEEQTDDGKRDTEQMAETEEEKWEKPQATDLDQEENVDECEQVEEEPGKGKSDQQMTADENEEPWEKEKINTDNQGTEPIEQPLDQPSDGALPTSVEAALERKAFPR